MNKYLRDGMTEGFMLESLLMEGENIYRIYRRISIIRMRYVRT